MMLTEWIIALVSKTVMPLRVPTGQVFSHKLGVIAASSYSMQATLSSSLHYLWTVRNTSTMRADINYSPSDVFLTFPLPRSGKELEAVGQALDDERRGMMLRRGLGLTKLYNLVNDPAVHERADPDVTRLRALHKYVDEAILSAYGWGDITLDHGFYPFRGVERWTFSTSAQLEVLDRLLEENLRRARERRQRH